jgi:hypothetical protein
MPTPDAVVPQTFRCVQIVIPDSVGDVFFSVVMGQLGEMANQYYWKTEGDLTAEQAAFLMAQSAAMTDANGLDCEGFVDCNSVAECITQETIVQIALNNTLINLGVLNANVINSETTILIDRIPDPAVTEIAETGSDPCDLDFIWAGIRSMVERVDGNGRDILEDLAVINDKIEQWGELIDLVPILGDTIKDIGDLFTQILPDILNAYNSASGPAFLDVVACEIFQMVCAECRYPTFDEMLNYFGENSYINIADIASITMSDFWTIIRNVTLTSSEALWYTINAWQCFTLSFDSAFGRSYGKKSFEIWASFGEENPTNDWEILCGECNAPQTITFDFTVADGGFIQQEGGGRGIWTSGVGWESELGANSQQGVIIYKALPALGEIKSAHMEYTVGGSHTWNILSVLRDNQNSGSGQVILINTNTTTSGCKFGIINPAEHRDFIVIQVNDGNTPDQAVLTSLTLEWAVEKPTGWQSEGDPIPC